VLLSEEGIADLKRFEGCRLEAYQDRSPRKVWTIGWGDTRNVKQGDVITQAEADRRLHVRVREFEADVTAALRHPTTQGQFDAFVCLAYNIGPEAFRTSTLVALFNAGDIHAAAEQWSRWVHTSGIIDPVLVRRRFCEIVRFFS
jgi:lysozyme